MDIKPKQISFEELSEIVSEYSPLVVDIGDNGSFFGMTFELCDGSYVIVDVLEMAEFAVI